VLATPHPTDWLDVTQAAALLRMSPQGVRSAVYRGELAPDGRGGRRCVLFRRATLDRFLEARALRYVGAKHAALRGEGDAYEEDEVPRGLPLSAGRYRLDATGWCPKTGKRKRKRRDVEAATAADAARMRADLRVAIERGGDAPASRERLRDVAHSWLAGSSPS